MSSNSLGEMESEGCIMEDKKTDAMEPEASRTIKCTYADCKLTFTSESLMIHHKILDPAHDYCVICAQDFENQEEYFIHVITNDKHIACPTCYREFFSEAGLSIHIRRNHPFPQDIKCICGRQFFRVASIIGHIEYGKCTILNTSWLRVTRIAKLGLHYLTLKPGKTPELNRLIVHAPLHSQLSTEEQMEQLSIGNGLIKGDATIMKPKGTEVTKPLAFDFSEHSWPCLGEQVEPPKGKKRPASFNLGQRSAFAKFSSKIAVLNLPDPGSDQPFVQMFNPRNFPTVLEAICYFRPDWVPRTYFHKLGYYRCECGNIFTEINDFENHMLGHMLAGFDLFNCPGCTKDFRNVTTLMSHIESMARKCTLHTLNDYAKLVDALSAGVVNFGGYHADGSGKFVAGTIEVRKQADTVFGESVNLIQGK